jgi:hypothetical protein
MSLLRRESEDVMREFESIKHQANRLRQSLRDSLFGSSEELKNLVEAYKDAKLHFGRIVSEQEIGVYLRDVELKGRDYSAVYKQKALFKEIDGECDRAIGVLESMVSPFSKEELERLTALKQHLKTLRGSFEVSYDYHLGEALSEYERGAYLASALIASRVILYALHQQFGAPLAEKLQSAQVKERKGKPETAGSEVLLAAYQNAKNFFSYDLTIVPSSAETLALLSEAFDIVELIGHESEEQSKSG